MLTADLIRPRIRIRGNEIMSQPLSPADRNGLRTAAELVELFQAHRNHPRWELNAVLEEYEGDRLDYPVLRGMAKVLSDAATFANEPPVNPAALRAALFERAAERGPGGAAVWLPDGEVLTGLDGLPGMDHGSGHPCPLESGARGDSQALPLVLSTGQPQPAAQSLSRQRPV